MQSRIAKKRTLEKQGFVHVSGWVRKDDAQLIEAIIEAEKPEVEKAMRATP